MTTTNIQNSTELKYQQAVRYFTQTGITHALKRQWEFLKNPDQKYIFYPVMIFDIGVVTYCTYNGFKIGQNIAEYLSLRDGKRQVVVLCGTGAGFATGVTLSVVPSSLAIEHSKRIENWKGIKINEIVGDLMRDEFESDLILSQFRCAISQAPIFSPTRTPAGQVFEYDALMQAADKNGMIKDIYNKRIPAPTTYDPAATQGISYSIGACVRDSEMVVVIYKRYRHLATQKSKEEGLSPETRQFFMSYRNSLGEFVTPIYMNIESSIVKKRDTVNSKQGVTEEESQHAELVYKNEISAFKELLGDTPLSVIDWTIQRDWMSLLNARWMSKYHT